MKVLRRSPLIAPPQKSRSLGQCSACDKQIARTDDFVFLYGEAIHRDCAFYRSRERRAVEPRRNQPA
jgi:hypothetical protein